MAPDPTFARAPIEPSAAMRTLAKALREMFVALINEGFTEQQAMHIIGVSIAANTQGGQSSGGSST